jgi:hypothetical protein
VNSCVCEDALSSEQADVCEDALTFGHGASEVSARTRRSGRGNGAGIVPESLTGRAECGASVEIACDPGENHTRTLARPVFMIENIRTSKYDRCSNT